MLQRAAIATALACGPELVIADEPTTALDVLVQVQVIESFLDLVRELGTSVLVITHDLRLLERMADRVAAMYAGKIVEFGPVGDVLTVPRHHYPAALLASSVLSTDPGARDPDDRRAAADAARGLRALRVRTALPAGRRDLLERGAALRMAGRERLRVPSPARGTRLRAGVARSRTSHDRPIPRSRSGRGRTRQARLLDPRASAWRCSGCSRSSRSGHRSSPRPTRRSRASRASARPASRSRLATAGHPLGTDPKGRDLLARILYGGRLTLVTALAAVGIATVAGVVVGLAAASTRRFVGSVLMRFTDLGLAIPGLLLAASIATILGRGVVSLVLGLAAVFWAPIARVTYGQAVVLREREYVEAARVQGAGSAAILVRHVFPHLLPVVGAYAALSVGWAVLFESALGFLGAGIAEPEPSIGNMLGCCLVYYRSHPGLILFPAVFLFVLVASANLVGESLRVQDEGER